MRSIQEIIPPKRYKNLRALTMEAFPLKITLDMKLMTKRNIDDLNSLMIHYIYEYLFATLSYQYIQNHLLVLRRWWRKI